MPINLKKEQDIIDAYNQIRPQESGWLQSAFDTAVPAPYSAEAMSWAIPGPTAIKWLPQGEKVIKGILEAGSKKMLSGPSSSTSAKLAGMDVFGGKDKIVDVVKGVGDQRAINLASGRQILTNDTGVMHLVAERGTQLKGEEFAARTDPMGKMAQVLKSDLVAKNKAKSGFTDMATQESELARAASYLDEYGVKQTPRVWDPNQGRFIPHFYAEGK